MERKSLTKQRSKYGNKKVEHDGIKFDSEREYKRYLVLKDCERKGVISCLEVHPKYELIPAIYREEVVHLKTKDKVVKKMEQRPISYTADFRYVKDGETIVEDVKISEYLLPKEYILKEHMMRYFHGIKIKRVYKASDII